MSFEYPRIDVCKIAVDNVILASGPVIGGDDQWGGGGLED